MGVVVLVGVHGAGAREERGLLERHDDHHRGRDQQTEEAGGLWERTRYIIHLWNKCCSSILGLSLFLSPWMTNVCAAGSSPQPHLFPTMSPQCNLFDSQAIVVRASTQLWAQMCRRCSKGRHTASCRRCIWTSRRRFGPGGPTSISVTGRVCCSKSESTWPEQGTSVGTCTVLPFLHSSNLHAWFICMFQKWIYSKTWTDWSRFVWIDVWSVCVCVCKTTMFCRRLRERHQDVLRQKLFKLKQEQGVESEPLFPIIKEEPRSDEEV